MNRFKTKKRVAKDDTPSARPSLESESSFNLFRRGKKSQEPEQKKDLDLTTALPSENDFRTSLLMSGLSARFSMLREQDDPNTKIGKASDDSVLFPKRQSRLADLGFSGTNLGDIAEVQSIRAPPFLRADSITSTDSGSIMTRSKPTESNVLFGGRQKVYKITGGASSSRNLGDGMTGRTLYDDDVPLSAFQRWRQTEKEKERDAQGSYDGDDDNARTSDGERTLDDSSYLTRSESPLPHGYNRKRETSSTTSSTPSGGRNSTAATSVVSQPTAFTKDSHSQPSTAISSTNSTPALERHVTRTRRLYEQGLTQDLHEQQHSVLSRVDTLTRKLGGARTPDLGPNSPSPTMQAFSDRFAAYGSERRTVLSKGSAPNLRSMSPPATGSLNGTMDLSARISNQSDSRGAFSPPLSPPISDAGNGDLSLHIQPQDHGKATAMNVFQKPISPYDDTKYAERQRQLQQGRETPTQRFQDESVFSMPETSQSSAGKEGSEARTLALSPKMSAPSYPEPAPATLSDEIMESPILNDHITKSPISPQLRIERPSDHDHPAFRQPTVPAPLTLPSRADQTRLPRLDTDHLTVGTSPSMLADSPTLGPTGGLSGMVRQHLRSGSDVSSIYGPQSEAPVAANRLETTPPPSHAWEEQDWNVCQGHDDERSPAPKPDISAISPTEAPSTDPNKPLTFLDSPRSPDEEDEFASQLASARRRVREKLTSFVETDGAPAALSPPMSADQAADLPLPPSRSNPLGILRGRGSRGSLVDRGRDVAPKPFKEVNGDSDQENRLQEEENAHPGLRNFRQARRELQKGKEFEAMMKRSPSSHAGQFATPPIPETPLSTENDSDKELTRNISMEQLPSGIHQPRQMNHCPRQALSPPPRSQPRPSRDRSGSENSDGSGPSRSRPPMKFKEHSSPIDEHRKPKDSFNHPSMRMAPHPGLPGTDVRRSPIMPTLGSSRNGRPVGGPSPSEGVNTSFKPMSGRSVTEPTSATTSPLSLRGAPTESSRSAFQSNGTGGSTPITPSGSMPRRPSIPTSVQPSGSGSTLTDSMKRVINKKDISEPTFLMSTSRVPTTSLPQSATETREDRSRGGNDGDYGSPPPVPPVNPRRRNSSRPRTVVNGLAGRNGETDNVSLSASTPHLPIAPSPMSAFAESPIEERTPPFSLKDDAFRRKLKKANSEMRLEARAAGPPKRASPPQVAVGPPAGRAVVMAPSKRGPSSHMPGGMF